MKKTIITIFFLAVFCVESAICAPQLPYHSHKTFIKFVQDVKKKITIERSYKIETEESFVLTQGQAVHIDFEENPAGVAEFILFYNDESVHVIYRCTDDREEEYNSTSLHPERLKDYRGIAATGASTYLNVYTECKFKNGKAFVKFRTEQPSKEELEKIKSRARQGNKQEKQTKDGVVQQLREMVLQEIGYKFGTSQKVIIVPDKNAVLLKCGDNPEDVKEIIIGANSKHLYIYCILTSGAISGGGSTWNELTGSFRQVGYGGSAAIGMWKLRDEKIHLEFQLTNDDNTMIQAYRKLEERGRFSKMIKRWASLFDNIELMFPRLTQAQRVEAFTRLWSMVKFNFANFDLVGELNWDDILSEYIPNVISDQSNNEYIRLLQRCIAKLKDGHTSVGSSWGNGLPSACPPLRIRSIDGNAIITEIVETEQVKASSIKPGDEITHVGGLSVQELLANDIYPYICASTEQGRDLKAYPKILQGPKDSTVSLRIKTPEGIVRKVFLTRKSIGLALLPRKTRPPNFEYREMQDGISYIGINTFGSSRVVDSFHEKFDKISQAKGLIIDVRKNGGGSSSNGDAIIKSLIDRSIPHTLWKTPQHIAAFEAWGRPKKWFEGEPRMIKPNMGEKYLGPLVILIGPETFSAAEDFVVPLHAAGRATIVGQKSGGSTGQPLRFSFLEGKISGRICTKRDTYPDGREFVGVGIIPDVEVNPTPADIIAGRDVVLEKAIEILKNNYDIRMGMAGWPMK